MPLVEGKAEVVVAEDEIEEEEGGPEWKDDERFGLGLEATADDMMSLSYEI